MGPIERELRKWPSTDCDDLLRWMFSARVSDETFSFVTWLRAGDYRSVNNYAENGDLPDVLSEAIEAAVALGL